MTYPFPDDIRNPNRTEPNPFADDPQPEPAPSAEAFASSATSGDYHPEYVAMVAPRGKLLFLCGVVGFVFSGMGWAYFADVDLVTTMPLASLVFSLPAFLMGFSTRSGIRQGKIRDEQGGLIFWGTLMGVLAFGNAFAFYLLLIYLNVFLGA